jgi:hypothetical protein
MDSNTKKILYYGGGAILVGAVAFFVYSFFKKDELVLGNTALSLGEEEPTEGTTTGGFIAPKIKFSEGIKYEQTPLKDLWNKLK